MGIGKIFVKNICGIILRDSKSLSGIDSIKFMGRTSSDWVAISLGDGFAGVVDMDKDENLLPSIISHVDKSKPITVALFADTPLITRKTVMDAVTMLSKKGVNVLRMTRGYVFKTDFLLETESITNGAKLHYFEEEDLITASDYKQVALITDILKSRILNFHMSQGVHIVDPPSTFIDCDVTIGKGVRIEPNNILRGKTIIKDGVVIESGSNIDSSVIDDGARVMSSRLERCYIGKRSRVGPYAYIRPDSVIGDECRIGDFVEIKKSIIGNNSKVSHLAYVGDAEIGQRTNIGCGVVFVNYDGVQKYPSKVGNDVFVGSNSNLVAPISICDRAYIAAGSTIVDSVVKEGLAIARARQVVKEGWSPKK